METAPLFIVDIIGEICQKVSDKLQPLLGVPVRYEFGRSTQILEILQKTTQAIKQTTKNAKYPLIALFMDLPERVGDTAYYCTVNFPKISIACLTVSADEPRARYAKNFGPILYPIYQEFFRQLPRHPNVVGNDPRAFVHTKWDRPGSQPEGSNLNDYLDAIEIQGLSVTFKQNKFCKPKKS